MPVVIEMDEAKGKDGEPSGYMVTKSADIVHSNVPLWLEWPLFYFPYTVNDWTVRIVGCQVCITSIILAIVGLSKTGSRLTLSWFSSFLFVGYFLRFIWGGSFSLFGAVANIVSRNLEANPIAGAPKQFASFIGLLFSLSAMIGNFYGPFYVGPIIHLALAGASGLEGFYGFCLGCWFFEKTLVRLNLVATKSVPRQVEVVGDSRKQQTERFMRFKWNESRKPTVHTGYIPATTSVGRPLLLKYSDKTLHQREDDVDYIRHCKLSYALPGAGWAATAAIFKALFLFKVIDVQWPWATMTVVAVILFGIFSFLYGMKAMMYPRKIVKDFEHLMGRYMGGGIPVALLLFGYLAQREHDGIARGLFWVGALLNISLTFWNLARLFVHPVRPSEINPAITIFFVGNILAAFTLGQWLDWDGISDLSFALWTSSFALWVLTMPAILLRMFDSPTLCPMARPSVALLMAAPSLAAGAYHSTSGTRTLDSTFLALFFLAVFFKIFLLVLFLANFFRPSFTEAHWLIVFGLATVAIPLLIFDQARRTEFTYAWLIAHFALTLGLALIFTANTFSNAFNGKWFRHFPKPGCISPYSGLGVLTHDAMRTAGEKLKSMISDLKEGNMETQRRDKIFGEFVEILEGYLTTLTVHSKYENDFLFPLVDRYMPGRQRVANKHHDHLHTLEQQVRELFGKLKLMSKSELKNPKEAKGEIKESKGDPKDTITALSSVLPQMVDFNRDHMRYEEDHITPIMRKYLNGREIKKLSRRIIKSGTHEQWRTFLPFVITHQDYHQRRVKFLESMRIAFPERMQMFGMILYLGIGETLFDRLRMDIPEIAPRNTPGHWRLW